MDKREKVIKGLEKMIDNAAGCTIPYDSDCKTCPYLKVNGCCEQIAKDALELLKAQEPKKAKVVILQRLGSDALIGYECGNCGKHINQNDKYCHECGQAVKWE